MKARIAYACGLVVLAFAASAAWAEAPDAPPGRPADAADPPRQNDKMEQAFKAMDSDGDGNISLEEFRSRAPRLMQHMRQHGDQPEGPSDRPGPKDRPSPPPGAEKPAPPDLDPRLAAFIDHKIQEALDRRFGELKKRLPEMLGQGMGGRMPMRWSGMMRGGMRRMGQAWGEGMMSDRNGPPARRGGGGGFGPPNRGRAEGRNRWNERGRPEPRWERELPRSRAWDDDRGPARRQGPPSGADCPEPPGPGRGTP